MGFAQKGGREIAVTMASAKKVRRQKILKIFTYMFLSNRKELLCGRPCEKSVFINRNAVLSTEELSTENCPPLLVITSI